MAIGARTLLLWTVVGVLAGQGESQVTPCTYGNDTTGCLAEVRRYFDSTQWWFGDSFSTDCPGVTPGSDVTNFQCQNPSSFKTIGSRLLQSDDSNSSLIEQTLRIRYYAPSGNYFACGHKYSVPEVLMANDVDNTNVLYLDSWSLQQRPAVIWSAKPDTLYTLAVFDVGQMTLQGLWVNIHGADSALGEEIVPYGTFLNPVDRQTFLVFALFVQNETVPDLVKDTLTHDFWMASSDKYLLSTAIAHLGHRIKNPTAIGYVSIWTDPFSIQRYKDKSLANNCPFLASRNSALVKIMDVLNLTSSFSTSYDFSNVKYFDDLDVQVEAFYWSDAVSFNVCCSVHETPERLVLVDFLSPTPVPTVYLTHSPDIVLSPVDTSDPTFFLGKWFTILLLDVTEPLKNVTNPVVTSLEWLVTDHQGPSLPGHGITQHNYSFSMPAVGETRTYMFLVFRQKQRFGDSFSLEQFCRMGDLVRIPACNLDLHSMVSTHELHFSGVNWFQTTGDFYLRWKLVQDGVQTEANVCQGITGYANPCPVMPPPTQPPPTQPPATQPPATQRPTTKKTSGGRASVLAPSWSFMSYLLSALSLSFVVTLCSTRPEN